VVALGSIRAFGLLLHCQDLASDVAHSASVQHSHSGGRVPGPEVVALDSAEDLAAEVGMHFSDEARRHCCAVVF
jgi:hypothetical protein